MMKHLQTASALLVGLVAGTLVSSAVASRNSAGTYTLPSGNPVVSGTAISSSWANSTLSDIQTELTNSLDRNGRGAMAAPLQCSAGSAAAPSLTFAADTNSGLFLDAADNPAVTAGGTKAQEWTATTSTMAVPFQGVGAGSGVSGLGGATSGSGVSGTGGATSGSGVSGLGGAPNGIGVWGDGTGAGQGVRGVGGATGKGVTGTGGATSGIGVYGTGTASESGVAGVGGATSGTGVGGTGGAPNGVGVWGNGTGTGAGTKGENLLGTGPGVEAGAGHLKLSGGNPASNTAFTNHLTPMNLIKAWVSANTNGASAPSVSAGFNIASVTEPGGDVVRVTFAQPMANAFYAVLVTPEFEYCVPAVVARTTTYFELKFTNGTNGLFLDPASWSLQFFALVLGAQ